MGHIMSQIFGTSKLPHNRSILNIQLHTLAFLWISFQEMKNIWFGGDLIPQMVKTQKSQKGLQMLETTIQNHRFIYISLFEIMISMENLFWPYDCH